MGLFAKFYITSQATPFFGVVVDGCTTGRRMSWVFFHTPTSSFWTSRGNRFRSFSPSVLAFIFYCAQGSAIPLLVEFSSSVANSRSRAFRKSICAQVKVPLGKQSERKMPTNELDEDKHMYHVLFATASLQTAGTYLARCSAWGGVSNSAPFLPFTGGIRQQRGCVSRSVSSTSSVMFYSGFF